MSSHARSGGDDALAIAAPLVIPDDAESLVRRALRAHRARENLRERVFHIPREVRGPVAVVVSDVNAVAALRGIDVH